MSVTEQLKIIEQNHLEHFVFLPLFKEATIVYIH